MIAPITQKFAEQALNKPIETVVVILAVLVCGLAGFVALFVSDKIFK